MRAGSFHRLGLGCCIAFNAGGCTDVEYSRGQIL